MIFRLAEATCDYEPIEEGERLVTTARYRLFLGRGDFPSQNCAQHLRLQAEEVRDAVEEVRAHAKKRGRTAVTWEVASEATPAGLAQRLVQLGMTPGDPPMATVMCLRAPPRSPPGDVVARAVTSLEEFRDYLTITHEVFDRMERLAGELARIEQHRFDDRRVHYLARIDDVPVAAARATFTADGVILNGGGTRTWARGRGAYRALVVARWEDAVRRGTPVLVTRSGPMSRPILERMGFLALGEIRFLIDRFG